VRDLVPLVSGLLAATYKLLGPFSPVGALRVLGLAERPNCSHGSKRFLHSQAVPEQTQDDCAANRALMSAVACWLSDSCHSSPAKPPLLQSGLVGLQVSQCRHGCIDQKRRHCHLAARAVDHTLPLLRYSTFALRDALGNVSHSCRDALPPTRMCSPQTAGSALDQPRFAPAIERAPALGCAGAACDVRMVGGCVLAGDCGSPLAVRAHAVRKATAL
jgi:hypothetical protein